MEVPQFVDSLSVCVYKNIREYRFGQGEEKYIIIYI